MRDQNAAEHNATVPLPGEPVLARGGDAGLAVVLTPAAGANAAPLTVPEGAYLANPPPKNDAA